MRTERVLKCKRKPKRPRAMFTPFHANAFESAFESMICVADIYHGSSKDARRLAKWLLQFADWAEAEKRKG